MVRHTALSIASDSRSDGGICRTAARATLRCTRPLMPPLTMAKEWVAAAESELLEAAGGEGRTVNRDWSNKHHGRFSPGRTPLVLVVI